MVIAESDNKTSNRAVMAIPESDNKISNRAVFRGKQYVFAIGIDKYQHCNTLNNAVKDAKDVVTELTTDYQFEATDVTTLYNSDATRSNIYKTLDKLVTVVQPTDTLLIYFSGHGQYIDSLDEGYWIPVEGLNGDTSTFVSNSDIAKKIKAIPAFHIVVISDSCFSGALFGAPRDPWASLARQEAISSRWLFTSGRNTVVDDGKAGNNSPFADGLLYHLKNNKAPIFPITKLSSLTTDTVAHNSEQLPRCEPMQGVKHKGGEFMFRLKGAELAEFEVEPKSDTPSVKRDIVEPTAMPKPIFQRLIKKPATWAAVVGVLATSVAVYQMKPPTIQTPETAMTIQPTAPSSTTVNETAKPAENTKGGSTATNSSAPKSTEKHKSTEKEVFKKPTGFLNPKVGKDTEGGTETKKPPPVKPVGDDPPVVNTQMCPIFCKTFGVAGVQIDFVVGNKSYSKTSTTSSSVNFEIPCSMKRDKVSVTFTKSGMVRMPTIQLSSFEIPADFKEPRGD